MRLLHLSVWTNGETWCDESGENTEDEMLATCTECLRIAAEYGAKAAVRYMAVENATKSTDSELEAERDAAIEFAKAAHRALHQRGLFICQECGKTRSRPHQIGFEIQGDPPSVWCSDCKHARS